MIMRTRTPQSRTRRLKTKAPTSGATPQDAELYAINLAKTEFREGYNTGNIERLLSPFADGFLYFSEGTPSFGGNDSKLVLGEQARRIFRQYDVKLFVIIAFIQLFGDSAYDWGWHEFTLTPKGGGEPIKLRKRYIEVWQKADEQWKLALYFDNNDLPPVLADSYFSQSAQPYGGQ